MRYVLVGVITVALSCASAAGSAQASRVDIARRAIASTVRVEAEEASASGFVMGPERWIVTTYDVIDRVIHSHPWDATVTVRFSSGTNRVARVLRWDAERDLALLEIEGGGGPMPPLDLATANARVGQDVLTAAVLGGQGASVHSGIVVGFSRSALASAPAVREIMLTDAILGSGSAGGPVLDASGRVIAVSVSCDLSDGGASYAIPSTDVSAFVAAVRAARAGGASALGSPTLADLGVRGEAAPLGVRVLAVVRGSPADRVRLVLDEGGPSLTMSRAGLMAGQVISAVDGVSVHTPQDLDAALATRARGSAVQLSVRGAASPASARLTATVVFDLPP